MTPQRADRVKLQSLRPELVDDIAKALPVDELA